MVSSADIACSTATSPSSGASQGRCSSLPGATTASTDTSPACSVSTWVTSSDVSRSSFSSFIIVVIGAPGSFSPSRAFFSSSEITSGLSHSIGCSAAAMVTAPGASSSACSPASRTASASSGVCHGMSTAAPAASNGAVGFSSAVSGMSLSKTTSIGDSHGTGFCSATSGWIVIFFNPRSTSV